MNSLNPAVPRFILVCLFHHGAFGRSRGQGQGRGLVWVLGRPVVLGPLLWSSDSGLALFPKEWHRDWAENRVSTGQGTPRERVGDGQWGTSHPDLPARSAAEVPHRRASLRKFGRRALARRVQNISESGCGVGSALLSTAPKMGFALAFNEAATDYV